MRIYHNCKSINSPSNLAADCSDTQTSPESLQDLIGKSESFLQQLHSTPNRARSGTVVGYSRRFCPSFLPDLYNDSSDSTSQTASTTQPVPRGSDPQLPGFHSPLDDILLQSQPYAALSADPPSGFDSGLPSTSDPVSIPGRVSQPRDRLELNTAAGSDRYVNPQSAGLSEQCVQNQDNQLASGSRPVPSGRGMATQQNTWPMTYTQTPVSTGSRSNFPSPRAASSQISHSFSPAVGTPANARFTGPHPVVRSPVQLHSRTYSTPPTSATGTAPPPLPPPPPSLQLSQTPAQTTLNMNQCFGLESGNGVPLIVSKVSGSLKPCLVPMFFNRIPVWI